MGRRAGLSQARMIHWKGQIGRIGRTLTQHLRKLICDGSGNIFQATKRCILLTASSWTFLVSKLGETSCGACSPATPLSTFFLGNQLTFTLLLDYPISHIDTRIGKAFLFVAFQVGWRAFLELGIVFASLQNFMLIPNYGGWRFGHLPMRKLVFASISAGSTRPDRVLSLNAWGVRRRQPEYVHIRGHIFGEHIQFVPLLLLILCYLLPTAIMVVKFEQIWVELILILMSSGCLLLYRLLL